MTPLRTLLAAGLLACGAQAADGMLAEIVSAELGRRYEEDLFLRAARSDDPLVRAAAARAAGRIRHAEAIGWLLPRIRDEDGRVRRAALFALGQMRTASVTLPLRESLATLSPQDLPHALEALGKTGDARAVSAVVSYLTDRDPETRNQAALALFRLEDESALTELFAACAAETDPEPRWRQVYAAFRLLRQRARRLEGPVAVDAGWQAALRSSTAADRPFHERVFAAMALGATRGGETHLEPLLRDEDPRVVVAAIRGLALGPAEGRLTASWTATLRHKDALVRQTAVDAALHWKHAETLRAIAAGPPGRDAMRAHLALAEQGETIEGRPPPLAPGQALSEEWHARFAGATGRGLPDPGTLKTPDGLRAAAEACGAPKIEEETARRTLRALLAHEDGTVRATAAGAVAERGWKDFAGALVDAARTAAGPDAVDARTEVANALAKMKLADPWLREAADDAAHPVRDAAREALAALGEPVPPARPRAGFRLHGHDAAGVLDAARALRGARVTLETNRGALTMILLPDEAPAHCVNFATLVARGFYDGKTWHRVVADFVVQGGCPRGDGWGGPGYFVPDEIGTRPYVRGTVGMPKAGDDTGGCQIFITHLPTPHLDGRYTVYAQVIEGHAVLDRIRVGDRIERAVLAVRD